MSEKPKFVLTELVKWWEIIVTLQVVPMTQLSMFRLD